MATKNEANKAALWESLQRTDPAATKPFTRGGGFRGTQIDPVWRMKRLTETFGPVGEGWGYELEGVPIVTHDMVFIGVRLWYVPSGETPEWGPKQYPNNARWTGVQYGGTEIMRKRQGNTVPDDECFKMSVTDAVGKCALQLGLAADVYLGLFDDSKYRQESEAVFDGDKKREQFAKDEAAVKGIVEQVSAQDSNAGIDMLLKSMNPAIKAIMDTNPGLITRMKGEVERFRAGLPDYDAWKAEHAKKEAKK